MFTNAQSIVPLLAIFVVVTIVGSFFARIPWFGGAGEEATGNRLYPLDGLRGLLCFGVFAHHSAMTLQQTWLGGQWVAPEASVYDLAGKGSVALFFCITGFLFWGRLLRREGKLDWFEFYRGRFLRIVPLYAVSAMICLIVVAASPLFQHVSWPRFARLIGEMSTLGVAPWREIATPTGKIYPDAGNAGVVWSLRYEWVFYFALPALALFARGKRWTVLYIGWLLGLVLISIKPNNGEKVLMFAVGMIAAHFQASDRGATLLRSSLFSILVVVCAVLMMLLSVPHGSAPALTRNAFSAASNVILLGVFVPIACGNSLWGLLNLASLRFLGTISYSVYLLHGTVLYFARPTLQGYAGERDGFNLPYWSAILVAAVVVVILCSFTYRLIEVPFIELAQRLRRRAAPAPIGGEISATSRLPA